MKSYSIIIPVYNEAEAIGKVIEDLASFLSSNKLNFEIIVVDDCSMDDTIKIVTKYPVKLVENLQNFGYGYSLKRGINAASYENIIIIDGDGSYPVNAIIKLIDIYERGYDMVVGARRGKYYRGSFIKYPARLVFLWLSEFVAGRRIADINSGLRIFKKEIYSKYVSTLCGGFSFTTTLTLALLLNFHSVYYYPVDYYHRIGKSKVRLIRDTLRTSQILVEAILFYNPLKLYLLMGLGVIFIGILSIVLLFFLDRFIVGIIFSSLVLSMITFGMGLGVFKMSKDKLL